MSLSAQLAVLGERFGGEFERPPLDMRGLGMGPRFALLVLAHYADANNECFPSLRTIAAHLGLETEKCKQTRRHVHALRDVGLIEIIENGAPDRRYRKGTESNLYRLLFLFDETGPTSAPPTPPENGPTPSRPRPGTPPVSGSVPLPKTGDNQNNDPLSLIDLLDRTEIVEQIRPLVELAERLQLPGISNLDRMLELLAPYSREQIRVATAKLQIEARHGLAKPLGKLANLARSGSPDYFPEVVDAPARPVEDVEVPAADLATPEQRRQHTTDARTKLKGTR